MPNITYHFVLNCFQKYTTFEFLENSEKVFQLGKESVNKFRVENNTWKKRKLPLLFFLFIHLTNMY